MRDGFKGWCRISNDSKRERGGKRDGSYVKGRRNDRNDGGGCSDNNGVEKNDERRRRKFLKKDDEIESVNEINRGDFDCWRDIFRE